MPASSASALATASARLNAHTSQRDHVACIVLHTRVFTSQLAPEAVLAAWSAVLAAAVSLSIL